MTPVNYEQIQELADFEESLNTWRQHLIQKVLRWSVTLGFLALVVASHYVYIQKNYLLLALYWGCYSFLVFATFWSRAPYVLRIWIVMGLLYVGALFNFMTVGQGTLGPALLLALSFSATIFLGQRAGFIALGINILTMGSLGVAFSTGTLTRYGAGPASDSLIDWLNSISILTALTVFMSLSLVYIRERFMDMTHRAHHLAQALQETRENLEAQVAEHTRSIEETRQAAETAQRRLEVQMQHTTGLAKLNESLRGTQDIPTLAANTLGQLCRYLKVEAGALFVMQTGVLHMVGSYAYTHRKHSKTHAQLGEGLVGQAALEKHPIILSPVPKDYRVMTSGLLETPPQAIFVAPFLYEGQVIGALELATLKQFPPQHMDFLDAALESIAIAFNTALARARIDELLLKTQQQAQDLQAREENLRATNAEFEHQTASLQRSETRLREQQAELEATNSELEEITLALREQQAKLDQQNRDLKATQRALEERAQELALTSQYKSEFLANMSHELRTPLNSLLILARMLANNESGHLTDKDVESAQIIYNSGSDLLKLINDILDLSKVEAGRMTFYFEPVSLEELAQVAHMQFMPLAEEKELTFTVTLAKELPKTIETDRQRVEQIIKNLLANAFKFTEEGQVSLTIEPAPDAIQEVTQPAVAIQVVDTGIGITEDQQKFVFEAFKQADGSTSRKYGGTGLGLAICRELATQMGGKITLESDYGKGSTFTVYLPVHQNAAPKQSASVPTAPGPHKQLTETQPPPVLSATPMKTSRLLIPDDRDIIRTGHKVLLIIEDDPRFAKVVCDYAHTQNFKCLVAGDGETGLNLAETYLPAAIVLDLQLPRMSGWNVLESLKDNPDTRHIPIHIISASEETLDAYKMGAMGYLTKPITPEDLDSAFQRIAQFINKDIKTLLIVEDDVSLRQSVKRLLSSDDVRIHEAGSGQTALRLLQNQLFDCIILDLNLPDITGFEVLERINRDPAISQCPVIIYTGHALTEEENLELMKYANSVIVKGVKSPERLLDEAALFLHQVVAKMPTEKQRTIKQLHDREGLLVGKQVLVVDDDMRNAFALSKLLGERGLTVTIAPNGQKALERLEAGPTDFDIVLMDIMMPEMDGFEAIRHIRAQRRFRDLPILALTAKAMKGDAEKCIAAGANDYLSKPVDVERLFSMLRVWLYSR